MDSKQIWQTYSLSDTATDRIYRIARRLRHRAALHFKSNMIDLTPEQWRLLMQVAEHDGQPQSALADPVLNDHPNITRIIDGLEKRNLILRAPAPDDRRSTLIFLTKHGKDLINQYLPSVIEEKSACYDGLDETDIKELIRILSIIEDNLGL